MRCRILIKCPPPEERFVHYMHKSRCARVQPAVAVILGRARAENPDLPQAVAMQVSLFVRLMIDNPV
jgi:hypothetical protein